MDTCNYAQVKWTLAFSLLLFSVSFISLFFSSFMAKFYPAYSISFCASERRERRESSGFLVCNSLVGPGVNKKGRKSRTFFLGCRLLRSESRRRESQPSALARRRRRRSSDSVNMATNKMRRTRNQPTVDGVLLASCLVVLVSQPSRLSYVVNKNWC